MTHHHIRPLSIDDLPAIKEVIDSCELFPSEMLNAMTAGYFAQQQQEEIWLTMEAGGKVVAVAYCAPERMTEGTYNLYLIAIHKTLHGKGLGSHLMAYVEQLLAMQNVRILLVETSGLPQFERTRAFYHKIKYDQVATIPEFYQAGEDKVVFWKKLS